MALGEGRGSDSDTKRNEGVRMDCGGRTNRQRQNQDNMLMDWSEGSK